MTTAPKPDPGDALRDQTYVPDGRKELARVLSLLEHRERRADGSPEQRFLLAEAGEGEPTEIPEQVYAALLQVVRAMAAGKAVLVSPVAMRLTTQQAADLLGVSRPTVVKFIEDGKLAAERVGKRRMLLLDEVLAFQRSRRQAQYDFLAATAVDLDEESDPAEVRTQLRAVRKAVAARRRG